MITGGDLPLNENKITQCSADPHGKKTVCSLPSVFSKMKAFLKSRDVNLPLNSHENILSAMLNYLNLENESEIYTHPEWRAYFGHQTSDKILRSEFIPQGPANSTDLLDNFNIDETLEQWANKSQSEFNKKVYHVPFQMIDFAKTGSEFAYLDPLELQEQGFNAFMVVFNTDVSTGPGKHWFAIFGDLQKDKIVLEYFNSSGFPPKIEITTWLEDTCANIKKRKMDCEILNVANGRQLQYSRTECGVWSLVYILSRLLNHEPEWIMQTNANDLDMIEYRRRLFRE